MRKWLIIMLLSFSPGIVMSEGGSVRAGEHEGFTRLVIDIQPSTEWSIMRNVQGYEIKIPEAGVFDTSAVFGRIPTTRIYSLDSEPDGEGLLVGTNCECHITAFKWRADKLVVDINDGPGKADSPFEVRAVRPVIDVPLPLVVPQPARDLQVSATREVSTTEQVNVVETGALSALEKIVVESLARGAAQGLLTPATDLKRSASEGLSTAGINNVIIGSGRQPGLLAHTSIDLGKVGADDLISTPGIACASDSLFSVSDWGGVGGFFEFIAPLREGLTNELGAADHNGANRLAKAYLYFGFGREAKAVLALDDVNSQERLTLRAIASVIDGDQLEADIFSNQLDCDGPVAFWAFISRPKGVTKKGNRDTILNAFRNLPEGLQSHLAPRLSSRFLEVGDPEAAELAFSIKNSTVESKLAEADLQAAINGERAKATSLEDLLGQDVRMTPEALLEYLQSSNESGRYVDAEAMALAEILRFENAGRPIEAQLSLAQITAYLNDRDEADAFELMSEVKDLITPDDMRSAENQAIIIATADREMDAFLALAFSEMVEQADAAAQNAVAERLLKIGMPERASILIEGSAAGEAMMNRRYLRADAAVELGDFQGAIQSIAGLSTDRAKELRDRAAMSAESLNILGEVSVGNDWRLGNWARLSTSDDALLKSVSSSILAAPPTNSSPAEPLAFGKELISQSEQTRALLDQVLNRYAPVSQ